MKVTFDRLNVNQLFKFVESNHVASKAFNNKHAPFWVTKKTMDFNGGLSIDFTNNSGSLLNWYIPKTGSAYFVEVI